MVNGIIQDGGIKAQTAIDQYIYGVKNYLSNRRF